MLGRWIIPALGTMVLGLIAGRWLNSGLSNADKLKRFLIAGIAGIALGLLLHALGVCPIVKRRTRKTRRFSVSDANAETADGSSRKSRS